MALISDPDYLIHSLRLNYLRHVDDPFGSRIISLDRSYDSNSYIFASGLADVEKWPELAMPSSPAPSDDEGAAGSRTNGQARFPGGATGLKYTTTIMGPSRVGAMGIRVSGKRASISNRSLKHSPPASPDKSAPAVSVNVTTTSETAATPVTQEETEPPKAVSPEFRPKFKGAAEMEARRRLRMLARAPPAGKAPAMAAYLSPELSSSESGSDDEEEDDMGADEEVDFDLIGDAEESIELDGDEFDPEFAASDGMGMLGINSDSDGVSILSGTNSMMSTSAPSYMVGSSLPLNSGTSVRNRLSPVTEHGNSEEHGVEALPERPEESAPIESGFEMVIPAPKPKATTLNQPSTLLRSGLSDGPDSSGYLFARRPVPRIQPAKSALTAMLADTSGSASSNPFTELYSAISARSDSDSMAVNVYFPHACQPAGRPLNLNVRKDATVEEVLGFALWTYWEEGWVPKVDDGLEGEQDPKWETRCSAVGWVLRIAEDDGEVDEDFPPPDRTARISKFNFDAYAALEATPAQVHQNKIIESKIQRRLSRIVMKKKSTGILNATNPQATLAPPTDTLLGTSAPLSSLGTSVGMFPSSLGPSTSHGPPQFLRIRVAEAVDAGQVSTTIQASGGMYMAEVLEAVCQRQKKLTNPRDYALVLELNPTEKVLIPLDRTVKSLQGKRDLILMKSSMLQTHGVQMGHGSSRTTDPNASIIKRKSEVLEPAFNSMLDFTNAYRKWTVYRKAPMLVTRSARLLAIDGGYIHIIPMANKAKHVFDSGKTSVYHLKSVVGCSQSSKNSATFKLVIHSNAERNKRYDFEAESAKVASDIVQTIRAVKQAVDRSGTVKHSRRSRHVT